MTSISVPNPGFDLTGLKEGDRFLACSYCRFQLSPVEVCKPVCPDCGKRMSVYKVEPKDLSNS